MTADDDTADGVGDVDVSMGEGDRKPLIDKGSDKGREMDPSLSVLV